MCNDTCKRTNLDAARRSKKQSGGQLAVPYPAGTARYRKTLVFGVSIARREFRRRADERESIKFAA